MRLPLSAAAFALALSLPLAAHAGPCQDRTPALSAGARFAGEVRHVIDGQTVCIGRARARSTWIPVRLVDLQPKNPGGWTARRALSRVGMGKYAVCTVAEHPTPGAKEPVKAVCRVAGVSLGLRVAAKRGPAR